jgi:hypothetical protein
MLFPESHELLAVTLQRQNVSALIVSYRRRARDSCQRFFEVGYYFYFSSLYCSWVDLVLLGLLYHKRSKMELAMTWAANFRFVLK